MIMGPIDADVDRARAAVIVEIGSEAFERLFAEGRALSWDQVLAMAG
jgi:hypothetical protein